MIKNNRKGFTLLEMIVVIALVAILITFAAFGVARYMRNIRQIELDGVAEEIFAAAQNNLTMVYGQAYYGREDGFGTEDPNEEGVFYLVGGSGAASGTLLDDILPSMSIDESVRTGGTYIIRYHKATGSVLDVFYSAPSGQFSHTLTASDYSALTDTSRYYDTESSSHKSDRRSYGSDKSVIGFYGGVQVAEIDAAENIYIPILKLSNEERLTASIDFYSSSASEVNLDLIVTGKTSGNSKTINLLNNGIKSTLSYVVKSGNTYTVVLDDITSQATAIHFADLFPTLIPGEDISVQAVATLDTQRTESVIAETNSLFATVSGGKAEIKNIRHLENLSTEISAVSSSITSAVQISDISLEEFWNAIGNNALSITTCGSMQYASEAGTFRPILNSYAVNYDGDDHIIKGLTIRTSAASNPTSADAGLFGVLASGSRVYDLVLEDFTVRSEGGNAGALCGTANSGTISGVIIYNDKDNNTVDEESGYEISSSSGIAGGLIGKAVSSEIYSSAAAVYVKSDSGIAGGFIGMLSGGSVYDSYSGGHTKNSAYKKSLTGPSRINVQGAKAGGFIGTMENAAVSYCYSSSSVTGSVKSAGFICSVSGGSVSNSYSVGRVVSPGEVNDGAASGEAFEFIAEHNGTTFSGKLLYLSGVSKNAAASDITEVTGIAGKDTTVGYFILPEGERVSAFIYDDSLLTEYKGGYYFPTIEQLHSKFDSSTVSYHKTGITDRHHGDWQIPGLEILEVTVHNESRLYVEASPSETATAISLMVTGKASGVTRAIQISLADPTQNKITKVGFVNASGVIEWSVPDSDAKLPEIRKNGDSIEITFDDITKKNQHFYELFCDNADGKNLIPGEDIEVRGCVNEAAWSELKSLDPEKANSLFEEGSDYNSGKAIIFNTRHLQNLEPSVSKIASKYTSAVIGKSTARGSASFSGITQGTTLSYVYKYDGSEYVQNGFIGIYNTNLKSFDGDMYKLSGMTFVSVPASFANGYGVGNAGLFRYISSSTEIKNLLVEDSLVTASTGAKAGTIAAEITGGAQVKLSKVMAEGERTAAGVKTQVSAVSGIAGGLVGSVSNSTLTIEDSASTMFVTGGSVGGIIGNTSSSTLSLARSYASGHTNGNGKYDISSASACNIYGTSESGGLIGKISGGTVNVTYSFSTASVGCQTAANSGGILGYSSGASVSFGNVYTVAPVYNVKKNVTVGSSTMLSGIAGAVVGYSSSSIGKVSGMSTYYLDDVYETEDEIMPIAGGSVTWTAETIEYYSSSGNPVTGKADKSLIALASHTYDSSISGKEYPFAVWTNCEFKGEKSVIKAGTSAGKANYFYGDWAPVNASNSDGYITVSLAKAKDSISASSAIEDSVIGKQIIYKDSDSYISLPTVEPVSGYKFTGWYYSDNTLAASADDTTLEIRAARATGDMTIYAMYSSTSDKPMLSVKFFDVNPQTGAVGNQIGMTQYVEKWSSASGLVPTASKEGYKFIGWYTAPTGGVPVSESSNTFSRVLGEINAYARYEKLEYYLVYVNFAYISLDGTTTTTLPYEPYIYQVEKGKIFNETVSIPAPSTDMIPKSIKDENGTTLTGVLNATAYTLTLNTNKASTYTVYYTATSNSASNKVEHPYKIAIYYHDTADSSLAFGLGQTYSPKQENVKGIVNQMTTVTAEDVVGFTARPVANVLLSHYGNETVEVHYDRNKLNLNYNMNAGFSLDSDSIYYGTEFLSSLNSAKTKAENSRNSSSSSSNFVLTGWDITNGKTGVLYAKVTYNASGTPSVTYYNGGTNLMPDFPLVASATWSGTTTYTVCYWQQIADVPNENDAYNLANYVLASKESLSGSIGATTSVSPSDTKYSYFHLSTVNTIAQKTIASDGSTVINVYYDRNIYHVYFSKKSSKPSKTNTTVYDRVDGTMLESGGTYYSLTSADYYYASDKLYKKTSDTKVVDGVTYFVYAVSSDSVKSTLSSRIDGFYVAKSVYDYSETDIYRDLTITARYGQSVSHLWPSMRTPQAKETDSGWLESPALTSLELLSKPWRASIGTMPGQDTIYYPFPTILIKKTYPIKLYLQNMDGSFSSEPDYSYSFTYSSAISVSYRFCPIIDGFAILAYNDNDAKNINDNSEWDASYPNAICEPSLGQSTRFNSSASSMSFYYKRNTYKINFFRLSTEPSITTLSFKYGETISLAGVANPTRSEGGVTYEFDGWYSNSDCVGQEFNATNMKMPSGDINLYAKWKNPKVSVTFNLNKPATATDMPFFTEAGGTISNSAKSVQVELGKSLQDYPSIYTISGSSSAYTSAYTPKLDKWTFCGWYTDPSCSASSAFYPSSEITGTLNLYAKWEFQYTQVRVNYLYIKSDSSVINIAPSITLNAKIGDNLSVEAILDQSKLTNKPNSEKSYYPENNLITIVVPDSVTTPEINFYYLEYQSNSWSYDIEYYARYKDVTNGSTVDVLISTVTKKVDYIYQLVQFVKPSGYENYNLVGNEIETVKKDSASHVVKFYITPDTSLINASDSFYKYDGTKHESVSLKVKDVAFAADSYKAPSGVSFSISYTYPDGDPVNIGVYAAEVSVKVTSGSTTLTIWKEKANIAITRRLVVLESDSGTWTYNGLVHTLDSQSNVKASTTLGDGFASGDSVTYVFSIDSFRRNVGTSVNAFDYSLNSGVDKDNYIVSSKFGTLKVVN